MNESATTRARDFVRTAELPEAPPLRFDVTKAPVDFNAAKAQATVVGSDVIAFVKGVTPEQRSDIVNASLLAQLVAKKKVPEPASLQQVQAWYDAYFDALSHIGFVIQDKGFSEYREDSQSFEAHEAILKVAAVLLAGSPGALALVKTTLDALKSMQADSPWITVFNRESQSANTARFQVSLVDRQGDGPLMLALMAFGLQASNRLTQVLFFKFRSNDVTLAHYSGKVTINAPVLSAVRDQISGKLVAYATDYIAGLPEL
jgi:hypothetical protein